MWGFHWLKKCARCCRVESGYNSWPEPRAPTHRGGDYPSVTSMNKDLHLHSAFKLADYSFAQLNIVLRINNKESVPTNHTLVIKALIQLLTITKPRMHSLLPLYCLIFLASSSDGVCSDTFTSGTVARRQSEHRPTKELQQTSKHSHFRINTVTLAMAQSALRDAVGLYQLASVNSIIIVMTWCISATEAALQQTL